MESKFFNFLNSKSEGRDKKKKKTQTLFDKPQISLTAAEKKIMHNNSINDI